MTQTIRARGAADFLALVPHLAGYQPRDSLVLVPFRGTSSIGLLRMDLPNANASSFAATALGFLVRMPDADGLAIIVYADEPAAGVPHGELVAALEARADACGLRVGDALGVMRDGWFRYEADGPVEIRALSELGSLDLPPVEGDQAADVRLGLAGDLSRAAVASALRDIEDALEAVCGGGHGSRGGVAGVDPRALEAIESLDDSGRLWEEALTWVGLGGTSQPPYRAALMLWTLARPGLRDVALVQWCHGVAAGQDAMSAQLRWEAGEPYPEGPLFLAGQGPRPDAERLRAARDVAVSLASLATGRHRAAALAVAGWLSWAMGASTPADVYARAALDIAPALGLAEIVRDLACGGRLPEWAFTASPGA